MSKSQRVLVIASLAGYSVLVFVLDIVTPVGIDAYVLNLPVIVVLMIFRSVRLVMYYSVVCAAMVALGWVGSPRGYNPVWWDVLNRTMGVAAVWLIAFVVAQLINKASQLDNALGSLLREIEEHGQTRLELELKEERLRLAMEGVGMGTVDLNLLTGEVVSSTTYLRLLGYDTPSSSPIAIDLWTSCIHPDDLARVREARDQALRQGSAYSMEYRIRRADNGETAWLAIFGRFYYNESGEAIRFLGVAFDVTRRRELERDAVQREVLAIAAREQRQIGQELHDGVGQALTGLGLMAQSLAQRLPEAVAERRVADRLIAGLDNTHQQVRDLARGLIPVHVESRGLSAALDDLAAKTTVASGIPVTAECPEWVELPDHATATQLFRIAQEAVSNAVRHGHPRHVHVTLLTEPDGLRLRIQDDGVGMESGQGHRDGLGLRIMHYRAGQIGGDLHIGRSLEGGTVVSCTLPRSNDNDEQDCGGRFVQDESLNRG
jgi:PAS domain S-box-containing protein